MTKYANTATKRLIAIIVIVAIMVGLTGCAVPSSADVVETMKYPEYAGDKLSVTLKVGALTWTPLSQQGTYRDMRLEWEDELRILPYGEGDKNGVLYIDECKN